MKNIEFYVFANKNKIYEMTEPTATLECPVTPERIDQCPATPEGRISNGSGDQRADSPATNDSSDRTGTSSPPPNCAICLGRCINKCFTDNCVHHFCFNCLLEWSKIKPECPLCKQTFKSIIHNVRSPSQYEEYIVTPRPHAQPLLHRLNVFLSERPRFRYRATLQVRPHESEAIQQLLFQQAAPDHVFYDGWIQPNNRSNQNRFRRHVYDLNLYALPLSDITGRQRECSALFYRENPAQIHRLMPWLSREIHVLSNNIGHRTEYITNMIQNMLEEFDISSSTFLEALEPHLILRTRHFIHEFLVFARSPYDMYGYDRNVRYGEPGDIPRFLESNIDPVVISTEEEITDDEEEDDDVRLITRGGSARTEFTIETRSNMSTVIVMGSLGRSTYSNDVSMPRDERHGAELENGNNTLISGSNGTGPLHVAAGATTQTEQNASGSQVAPVVESLLTDSDSDDCLFVREQKPPHLRTPELVVLNSEDEDSDVVFVEENEQNLNELEKKISVAPKKRIRMDESNDNASESEEVDSKYIPKIEMEISPQVETQSTVLAYSSSQPSTSTAVVNKNVSDFYFQPIKKIKTKSEHYKCFSSSSEEDEHPDNTENGPSTSISTSKTDLKRKLYFKPIRKHKVNPKNKNKIFDSSSSSSGSSDEEVDNDRDANDESTNDVANEMAKPGPSMINTPNNRHTFSKYVKYCHPSSSSDSSSSSSHEEYRIYNASKRKKQKATAAKRTSSQKSTSSSRSKNRGRSSGSKSVTSALIKKSIKNKKKSNKRSRKSKSYVIKINSSDSDSSSNTSSQSGKSRGGGADGDSSFDTGENHRTKKIQKLKLRLKRHHDTTTTSSDSD